MKILFCTDASLHAQNAIRFGSLIAAACAAETTILGIAESPSHEATLLETLSREQHLLRKKGVDVEMIRKAGYPVREIVKRTSEATYDLVVIGAARKAPGAFSLPAKAYKIIKRIPPPVVAVVGARS